MTTREEFRGLVTAFGEACSAGHSGATRATCDALRDAWDAQAAEVERLRAEVEALRPVPLTAENAPRAAYVMRFGMPWRWQEGYWRGADGLGAQTTKEMVDVGATVLQWRDPHATRAPAPTQAMCTEPTGVPLTAENAPRARVVEDAHGNVASLRPDGTWWAWCCGGDDSSIEDLLSLGITVLAWRK